MNLTDKELMNIHGGGISYGVYLAIGTVLTFIAGMVDGFLRPLGCKKK